MKTIISIPLLMIACALAAASEVKIAILNTNEVEELVKVVVLARPENVEAKKILAENGKKMNEVHKKMNEQRDDKEGMKKVMDEMQKINEQNRETEQKIERQVKSELIRICKEVSKGRYGIILNADYANEAIITKDAEMIDITIDVKEYMLAK